MKLFLVVLAAILLTGCGVWYMTIMPGNSASTSLPAPTAQETLLSDKLRQHIQVIGREEHNMMTLPALESVARYLEATLQDSGYEVRSQTYQVNQHQVRNIEVERRGGERDNEIILVGAHYDSVHGAPGANDNGSGVSAVLELARFAKNYQPKHTWRFVLFVNEEPPYFKTELMGSRVYARRCKERGEKIIAMYSLETIGYYSDEQRSQRYPFPFSLFYPDRGNFLGFVSNLASRDLLHRSIGAFREHSKLPSEGLAAPGFITGIDWSDHWSFWEEAYPALMITDTAPFRYPFYHTPQDTPDKIDYVRLEQAVSGLDKMLREIDREP